MCQISNHNPDLFVNIEVISSFLGKKILWPHLNENSINRNIKYNTIQYNTKCKFKISKCKFFFVLKLNLSIHLT